MITKSESKIYSIENNFDEAIHQAKKLYFEGKVFIYPTDTIYGFGANPFNLEAVNKIDEIKRRPQGKAYILLVDSIDTLLRYVEINSENHLDFLISIWPNPVSVVLKLNSKTREVWGIETSAFRIPNHRFCLKLLNEIKMPLISTSVNRNNQQPMVEPELIEEEFSSETDAFFFTNKKCFLEVSTLIDLSKNKPELLREGKIKFDNIYSKFKE